jgi:hypothetical protein
MMPFFLLPHYSLEPLSDSVIRTSISQHGAKVMFRDAEQAGSNLAVRCHSNAITMTAERLANRRNNSDLTPPILKGPTGGGL